MADGAKKKDAGKVSIILISNDVWGQPTGVDSIRQRTVVPFELRKPPTFVLALLSAK